jgi:hypothetical protein
MRFLHDKRRAGVVAVIGAVVGSAALFFGLGAAQAGYPCNDQPAPQDTTVNVSNEVYVGVDITPSLYPAQWAWVCVGAPGGEANQKFVAVTVSDPYGGGSPGLIVESGGCTGIVGGQGYPPGCTYLVRPVGFDANPFVGIDVPVADGTGTTGAGGSAGTCLWLESTTPDCSVGATITNVTIAEGDVSANPMTNPGGCVTAAGNPCLVTAPAGAGVSIAKGDPGRATVDGTLAGAVPITFDAGQCVGYNAPPGC